MSCPWAKIEKPEPLNLDKIMSEEFTRDLQAKEERNYPDNTVNSAETVVQDIPEVQKISSNDGVESNFIIAQMLQMQFDQEHDKEVKRTEEKFNGTSKVSILFDNYCRTPVSDDFENDSEEETIDIRNGKDWYRFDLLEREIASIPHCGYKKQNNGKLVTKNDVIMSGRKNSPPKFHTDSEKNFGVKLSTKDFNSLKMPSKYEQIRRYQSHYRKEDKPTVEIVLDQCTRSLLYKMINRHLLKRVNGVISIGKEAIILHADSDPSFPHATEELPKECVLKVFNKTASKFKQHDKYIRDEHRFRGKIGKQTSKKTIQLWAEKEMANLMRLKKAGIPCPEVVTLKKHVLVMSFIGENCKPAQTLKDAIMEPSDYSKACEQVITAMRKLYQKANLVHTNLSENEVLWHNQQSYIIDVNQCIESTHENAFNFLFRDCENMLNFFIRKGVRWGLTPSYLFKSITGCFFFDKKGLSDLHKAIKMKHFVDRGKGPGKEVITPNFETMWEKVKAGEIPPVDMEEIIPKVNLNLIEPPMP